MNTTNHISPDDLYLFALQLLPDAAMKDIALHLKDCDACRAQLGEIQGDLVAYALTAELHTPPAGARERLLKQVAEEKKVIPMAAPVETPKQQTPIEPVLTQRSSGVLHIDAPEERERRRLAPVMAWVGWGIAACVAVAAPESRRQPARTSRSITPPSVCGDCRSRSPARPAARAGRSPHRVPA